MADEIVTQLGPHASYWEPFCGSAAVLCAKPPSGHETINDLHGDLVNLAMVLASDRWRELEERLGRVLYCESLFHDFRFRFRESDAEPPTSPADVKDVHVLRAVLFFVVSWIGRNGVAGTARVNYQMALRWTPHGGSGPTRFASAAASIEAWHDRLTRVAILRRNAFELIPKIEDVAKCAIYVDPPYFAETRGDGGGARYEHDFKPEEHAALAGLLARFQKARVVVSYYDHPQLAELYPAHQWTKIDCSRQKNLHVQNRRGMGKLTAPEVLLVNGPVFTPEEL